MTIELKVIRNDDGTVQVFGPTEVLRDKFFCYAMFESGKDAIREFVAKQAQEQGRIQVARSIPPIIKLNNGDRK